MSQKNIEVNFIFKFIFSDLAKSSAPEPVPATAAPADKKEASD